MSECEKCKGATRHYGDSALCYDHQRERITALESERDGWRDHANKLAADKIALESAIKAHKASFVDDNLSMCDVDEKLWEVLGVQT